MKQTNIKHGFPANVWKVGNSFVVTIPSNIIKHSDIELGDVVDVTLINRQIKTRLK